MILLFHNYVYAQDPSKSQPLIIGALEDHYIEGQVAYKFQVRVLFQKASHKWIAFKHEAKTPEELNENLDYYPKRIKWFIAFDGKSLGECESFLPKKVNFYSDEGLHIPEPTTKLPQIGKRTLEFSGWIHQPCHRPLILVSENHTSDPESWKPFRPLPTEIEKCIPEFRKIIGKVVLCDQKHGDKPTSDYDRRSILVGKSYRANTNERLISLSLDPNLFKCDYTETGGIQWFYFDEAQSIKHLDVQGLTLLDAGDYDGDGTIEFIFWEDGYNENGYVLFYNHFKQNSQFKWGYH